MYAFYAGVISESYGYIAGLVQLTTPIHAVLLSYKISQSHSNQFLLICIGATTGRSGR